MCSSFFLDLKDLVFFPTKNHRVAQQDGILQVFWKKCMSPSIKVALNAF